MFLYLNIIMYDELKVVINKQNSYFTATNYQLKRSKFINPQIIAISMMHNNFFIFGDV